MKGIGVIVFAVGVACAAVTAQDDKIIYGEGLKSCGTWVQTINAKADENALARIDRIIMAAWVRGFLTGAGVYSPTAIRRTDGAGVEMFLDRFCADNPVAPISHAAIGLVYELAGR